MDQALANEALASGAGGVLRIDLGELKANYLKLCQLAAPTPVSAVVKANAYGLGVKVVSQTLYAAGCRHFFVALTHEAFELRLHLPGDAALYVLNGFAPGSEARAAETGLIPVLNSPEQLDAWAATAKTLGETVPALLQVDTGMSRLGFMPDDLKVLAAAPERLSGLRIDYLMSHLACADEPTHPANSEQLEAFELASRLFPDTLQCFANSGGLFIGAEYHADLCRPGIALYGGAPHMDRPNPMRRVIALDLAVVQTRTIPAGTRIGYGGTVVTDAPKRLATLSAGYADGLPRRLGDNHSGTGGAVYFNGVRLPFIGRVSMDSIIIDIDALPEGTLKAGDFVELIGPHQSLDTLAEAAGTIAYEILTQLGSRYYRHLIPAEA